MKPLRPAVLGAGEWACTYHLPALKSLERELSIEITGIWNRSGGKAVAAARRFGIPRVYADLEELVTDERPDCYILLVNSTALRELVRRLLPRRRPIFTEKPSGATHAEARELAGLVDVPNLVAFNRRYMPINRRFKALAETIADPYYAECQFYRSERVIEHFVRETGLHGINCMEYLCGPIRRVRTEKIPQPGVGTFQWFSQVEFESGLRGLLKFLPCSGSSLERYELHGRRISAYLHCPQTYTVDHPGRIIVHEQGRAAANLEDEPAELIVTAGFVEEYREFFHAVRTGAPTVSTFRNAENCMAVAEAIEAGVDLG
jgi:predicted dehydrogenase